MYKATMNIERDTWDAFKQKCEEQGTTASAEFRAFVECFMLDKQYPLSDLEKNNNLPVAVANIKEYLEHLVFEQIDLRLGERNSEVVERYLADRQQYDTDNRTDNGTDKAISDRRKKTTELTENKDEITTSHSATEKLEQSSMKNELEAESPLEQPSISTSETAKNTDERDANQRENDVVNTRIITAQKSGSVKSESQSDLVPENAQIKPTLRQARGIDNLKSFSDSQVAAIEGVSRQTISRYRRGKRKPKLEFCEKWGLNSTGIAWVKWS